MTTKVSNRKRSDPVPVSEADASDNEQEPLSPPTKLNHTSTNVSSISPSTSSFEEQSTSADFDYDRPTLAALSYAELASEPFDLDPRQTHASRPPSSLTSAEAIAAELEKMRQTTSGTSQAQHERFRAFFTTLDIDAHEIAGDVVMDKLAAILHDLKQIRRNKRQAALELEKAVAEREEKVREKREALASSMDWLREQGSGVVRGRG